MSRTKKVEIITEAKPHTIKKFELIEQYVDEWARKILGFQGKDGKNGSKGVIYIDCMSNSGVYKDEHGNLIDGTALRVAKRLNEIIQNYPDKNAILLFNDLYEERTNYLEEEINKARLENIKVRYYHGDCNAFLRGLDLRGLQKSHNTLLLYDPYNASIDWDAVTPFLNQWGEVIFNHMVSDTSRGASQAKKEKVIERYQETYQKDIDSIIAMGNDKEQLNDTIIQIINARRNQQLSRQYIASFPFFNRTNGLVYNLIHCCANKEGIKLFKRVAWKTFGDRSSLKKTHGDQEQFTIDFDDSSKWKTVTDEECYYVSDIAKYVYDKYSPCKTAQLSDIYSDLDVHPVFPSDGYKDKVKAELRTVYGVTFHRGGKVDF